MNYTKLQIGFGSYICLVQGYIIGFWWNSIDFFSFIFSKGHIGVRNGLRSASFMCCIIVPSPLSPFRGKLMEGGSLGSLWLLKVCRLLHQQVVKVDVSLSCDVSRWPTVHFRGTNGNSQSKRLHFHSNYQIRSFRAAPCIMGQTRQPHWENPNGNKR